MEPDTGEPVVSGEGPDAGEPAVSGEGPDAGEPAVSGEEPVGEDQDTAAGSAVPRRPVPGVIYLGYIPPGLELCLMRKMMSAFGEVGRIFLQPADERRTRRKKKTGSLGKNFTEGWVEFQNKAVAKRVARSLHNTPIGTKKRSRFHDDLWNMKYLHRFKWIHLSERLAYEKLVKRQRLRVEVSQAKRETNFFLQNVEKSRGLEKLQELKRKKGEEWQEKNWHFHQRATEAEIQASKTTARMQAAGKAKELERVAEFHRKSQTNTSLLARIFNPCVEQE
ncbi:activator of basal transcription 1 isoform X2 [Pristis pectinata]|uniref:activator of basal transcription 1 isoform X2 n=1 Tax=Pristis pectinata TaxID=685728 RepID=UPI00223E6DF8|nr:activator of basal transcription 1 isoform X2 [Pristis pectinata]